MHVHLRFRDPKGEMDTADQRVCYTLCLDACGWTGFINVTFSSVPPQSLDLHPVNNFQDVTEWEIPIMDVQTFV